MIAVLSTQDITPTLESEENKKNFRVNDNSPTQEGLPKQYDKEFKHHPKVLDINPRIKRHRR